MDKKIPLAVIIAVTVIVVTALMLQSEEADTQETAGLQWTNVHPDVMAAFNENVAMPSI